MDCTVHLELYQIISGLSINRSLNLRAVAAFKANTRNKTIDITDYEGSDKGWRVVKEFAWEHQMPLKSDIRIAGKKLK